MKTLVVTLVMLSLSLASTESNAAKCKWETNTVSYRTGEPVRWTRWVRNRMILTPPYAAIAGISEGEQKFLGLQIIAFRQSIANRPTKNDLDTALVIPAGSTLSISMADNSIYELVAPEDVIGDAALLTEDIFSDEGPQARSGNGYKIGAFAVIKFPLDAEAIAALTAQRASNMRLSANGNEYEFSFGRKPVNKIQKVLACIQ